MEWCTSTTACAHDPRRRRRAGDLRLGRRLRRGGHAHEGSVKLTVKGTKIRPLKVSVTAGGYKDLFWPQSWTQGFRL
jgi:hypothetical protein